MPVYVDPASRRRLLVAVVLGVLLVVGWRHVAASRGSPPLRVAPVVASSAPRPPATVVVDVAGAVRRPGLVRLRKGARVSDAITRAGGLAPGALRDAVNLAAPVSDGQQVLVPARGATVVASGGAAAPAGPVSLSAATVAQLDALPGVGPVTAQKIVDYRTAHGSFSSVDELDAIAGIGPARIENLRGLVVP